MSCCLWGLALDACTIIFMVGIGRYVCTHTGITTSPLPLHTLTPMQHIPPPLIPPPLIPPPLCVQRSGKVIKGDLRTMMQEVAAQGGAQGGVHTPHPLAQHFVEQQEQRTTPQQLAAALEVPLLHAPPYEGGDHAYVVLACGDQVRDVMSTVWRLGGDARGGGDGDHHV